jgi:hypothetical protein
VDLRRAKAGAAMSGAVKKLTAKPMSRAMGLAFGLAVS